MLIIISKTSRFYIGLAVGLPVFSNISIILTHVQTVLSLRGRKMFYLRGANNMLYQYH